jgi:uncharacterized protein YeaO (DUF488 family)
MDEKGLAYWLLDNGGPIIKFRTLVDIIKEQDVGVVLKALNEMTENPEVVKWLSLIHHGLALNDVHSGKPSAFENVISKLVQLGWRAGLQPFDNMTLFSRVWLSENVDKVPLEAHEVFKRTLVASVLARAGYHMVEAVSKQVLSRLNTVYQFAKDPDFSQVYVDRTEHTGIPKGLEKHDLVNPQLYPNQQFALPWIHDVYAFSHLEPVLENDQHRNQVEEILKMVLTPEYQNLPWSYGLARYGTSYYVLGPAAHLPGYSQAAQGREFGEMLLLLEALAPFRTIKENQWFKNSMKQLEEFRTERGTYSFPEKWLPERGKGYWVGGEYMAFDARQGRTNAIEVESTFRVLSIRKRTGL